MSDRAVALRSDPRRDLPAAHDVAEASPIFVHYPYQVHAMNRALALLSLGDLKPVDLAVFWCIATPLDCQPGAPIRRQLSYPKIALQCRVCRSTVFRAVRRLQAVDLIE